MQAVWITMLLLEAAVGVIAAAAGAVNATGGATVAPDFCAAAAITPTAASRRSIVIHTARMAGAPFRVLVRKRDQLPAASSSKAKSGPTSWAQPDMEDLEEV